MAAVSAHWSDCPSATGTTFLQIPRRKRRLSKKTYFPNGQTSVKEMQRIGDEFELPSSHYYLRSLSWTSRTFYFQDSRDLLEVLGGLPWQRERGVPRGSSRTLGDPPWGLSLCQESLREPRGDSENLGRRRSWRSKITNPVNNDYWVSHNDAIDYSSALA